MPVPKKHQKSRSRMRNCFEDGRAEQQRGNAAAQHDRARRVHAAGRQRARKQSHQPPKAAGRDDGRRILAHCAPLHTKKSYA